MLSATAETDDYHKIFPDHQQNFKTFPDQINALTFRSVETVHHQERQAKQQQQQQQAQQMLR